LVTTKPSLPPPTGPEFPEAGVPRITRDMSQAIFYENLSGQDQFHRLRQRSMANDVVHVVGRTAFKKFALNNRKTRISISEIQQKSFPGVFLVMHERFL
jgi:hypothetical protein